MNFYRYKLIAPTGKLASGVVKLPYRDIMSAISHLERDGSITVYVRQLGRIGSALFKLAGLRLRRKVSRPVLAEMLSNMALMLKSGLPLMTALEEAANSADFPDVRQDLRDMIMSIQAGMTFSEAADKYRHLFPATVIHLIRMGEETGRLDHMLNDAAEHIKRVHGIISDTKQALMYPAFVFFAIGAGLIFWFYYVVPKIISLFTEMDVVLPPLTLFLVYLSDFVRTHLLTLVLGALLAGVLLALGRRHNKKFRRATDQVILKMPIASSLVSASALAYISEYMAMLLNAGIDILQSMQIIISSVGNEIYKEKMGQVNDGITRGEGIGEAFKNAGIFPAYVVRMIGVGEMSGSLTEQLDHIAEAYRNKLSVLVSTLGKLLEPVVLVVAGVVFAVIIGALLLPIYDLLGKVSA